MEAEVTVCDHVGNCLPKEFGTVIPMISFAWSIFSVVLEAIDSLRLDNFLESLAFVLSHFLARILVLILLQSFLQVHWTLAFMAMVIASNALFVFKLDCLSCLKSLLPSTLREMFSIVLPEHKIKSVSVLVSFPLSVIVSEDITKKERGQLESAEDRRQAEKYLSVFSIYNMLVFLSLSQVLVYLVTSNSLNSDSNVILSVSQMHHIYLYIALPLATVAIIASVLLLLSPLLNDKLKKFLHVLIIAATIIYPIAAGTTIIEKSPTSVLIFVEQQECLHIFQGRTYSEQDFELEKSWNLFNGSVYSRENKSLELRTSLGNFSKNTLSVSFEMETLKKLGDKRNVFIEESTNLTKAKLKRLFFSNQYFVLKCCFSALKDRKVCLRCAYESNLCKRIKFSLTSDSQMSDADCECDQAPGRSNCKEETEGGLGGIREGDRGLRNSEVKLWWVVVMGGMIRLPLQFDLDSVAFSCLQIFFGVA